MKKNDRKGKSIFSIGDGVLKNEWNCWNYFHPPKLKKVVPNIILKFLQEILNYSKEKFILDFDQLFNIG